VSPSPKTRTKPSGPSAYLR